MSDPPDTPASSELTDRFEINNEKVTFECKSKKRPKFPKSPGAHSVVFTVNLSIGVPAQAGVAQPQEGDVSSAFGAIPKPTLDQPRSPSYYHVEYTLFPDESETFKTDVVLYGQAAKIFPEKTEGKFVRTWMDGEFIWIAWSQSFPVWSCTPFLEALTSHNVKVQIWHSDKKCSNRARFGPKSYRMTGPKTSDDNVRNMVVQVQKRMGKDAYKPKEKRRNGQLVSEDAPDECTNVSDNYAATTQPLASTHALPPVKPTNSIYALPNSDARPELQSYSRLERLAYVDGSTGAYSKQLSTAKVGGLLSASQRIAKDTISEVSGQQKPMPPEITVQSDSMGDQKMSSRRTSFTATGMRSQSRDDIPLEKRYTEINVPLSKLFVNQYVDERLRLQAYGIDDGFVSITLDENLLSDEQKILLNPVVIKLKCASRLPENPYNFNRMHEEFEPAYCEYSFLTLPKHRTMGMRHANKIVWSDIYVVLAGLMNPTVLREYLNGNGITVEIHDRDRKQKVDEVYPTLFGDDLEDDKICNVGVVTSKRTAFTTSDNIQQWDPYGVANVDISGILLGQKIVEAEVPIVPAPLPVILSDTPDKNGKIVGISGAVDGPTQQPATVGDYFEAGSTLSMLITLTNPIHTIPPEIASFGRAVIRFKYSNKSFLDYLLETIHDVNNANVERKTAATKASQSTLSNITLLPGQQQDATLNVVTGFHLYDCQTHVFVIEGPGANCIDSLCNKLVETGSSDVTVLFNNDLQFTERLYGSFGTELMTVKLHEPIHDIVRRGHLYIRDMVPTLCFQGIMRIYSIIGCNSLKIMIKNNYLPSAPMISSINKELALPLSSYTLTNLSSPKNEFPDAKMTGDGNVYQVYDYAEWQEPVCEKKRDLNETQRICKPKNFVKENIVSIREKSGNFREQRIKSCPVRDVVTANSTSKAHNYSVQRLNTTEGARRLIRDVIDDGHTYTYAPGYHNSGSFELIKVACNENEDDSRQWPTKSAWTYPGLKRNIEDNESGKKPDIARRESLQHLWRENYFNATKFVPPVPKREAFEWQRRDSDLNIWRQPARDVFGAEPHSMFSAGDRKQEELDEVTREEMTKWKENVVVENTRLRAHRLLPRTENRLHGREASNQLDRLAGLLKDPPMKKAFVSIEKLPALSVITGGQNDVHRGCFSPGEPGVSLKNSHIPRDVKGRDFSSSRGATAPVTHRRIEVLTRRERNCAMFQSPQRTVTELAVCQ